MERFMQLKELATQVGMTEAVAGYENRCASIGKRGHTGVVITGAGNCGKTTILNGITGISLRETSNIPDEAPPMRVCFERIPALEGFECRTVLNKQWNAENVVLYEMKLADILDADGNQKHMLDLADVVFYVVSALNPFTREDMEAIKALRPLRVQVVLNKFSLIRDGDKPKVEAYVKGVCAKLGLADPMVIREDLWDTVAKEFRDALPTSPELAGFRKTHKNALYQAAVKLVMQEAHRQMTGLGAAAEAALDRQSEEALECRRKQAEWKLLKAEMLEWGAARCTVLRKAVMDREAEVAGVLLKEGKASGFSGKWFENELPKQMSQQLDAIVEKQLPQIGEFMHADCEKLVALAVQRGLLTAQDRDRIDPGALTGIGIDKDRSARLYDTIREGSVQTVRADKAPANITLLIGTVAAFALVYLISPSVYLTFVPAGIGGVMLGLDGQSRKTVEWSKALGYYTGKNLTSLSDAVEETVRKYYDILAESVGGSVTGFAAEQKKKDDFRREEQKLAEVIRMCRLLAQSE